MSKKHFCKRIIPGDKPGDKPQLKMCSKLKLGNKSDRKIADRIADITMNRNCSNEDLLEYRILVKNLRSIMKEKYGKEGFADCLMNHALTEKQLLKNFPKKNTPGKK